MEILNSEEWRLKSLQIEFQQWGEHKGKYIGKITFANGEKDAFTFSLDESQSNEYLSLVRAAVITSANRLGDKVVLSMPKNISAPPPAIEDIQHE